MELEELNIIKEIVGEMVKTKKSHLKSIDRMYNTDPFSSSRANTTTMNANISKSAKLLYDYKLNLIKVINKL